MSARKAAVKRRQRSSGRTKPGTRKRPARKPGGDARIGQEFEVYREEVHVQNEQLLESQGLLETSRDRYIDLYDLAPVGYATLDEKGILLEINLTGAEIFGRARSDLVGLPFQRSVTPPYRRSFLDHLRRVRKTRETCSVYLDVRGPRGKAARRLQIHSRRTVSREQHPFILIAIVDVTERREMMEALGKSEARLHIAVAAAGAAMWEWDPLANRLEWSQDHYALLGYDLHSILPTFAKWVECTLPEDRPRLLQAGLHNPGPAEAVDVEYRVRAPSGSVRWLRTVGTAVRSVDGQEKTVGITMDISSLKAIEARLTKLNAALEERTREAEASADQLRSLTSELTRAEARERARLADILHDEVQQVLVAADMKLQQIMRRAQKQETRVEFDKLAHYLHEALRLTRSLTLDFNPRMLEGESFSETLKWQADVMKEEYGLCVGVEWRADREPREREVRAILLQAVKELLFNVVKHSGVSEAVVRVTADPPGDFSMEILDKGVGCEVRPEVSTGAKSGQGLARVRDRILALGGRFQVGSWEGRGTRAQVVVPASAEERLPETGAEKPLAHVRGRTRRAPTNGKRPRGARGGTG